MAGTLFIGTRRYSSWSMRGWLAVHLAGLDVAEIVIPLEGGATRALAGTTPNGLVPYLEHDGARVWESIAIAEYCAEIAPGLWPADRAARAAARSASAEMHAGFASLRRDMPMILGRSDLRGRGHTPAALADIARIETLWAELRQKYGERGPYLFGPTFTMADVMFAPVVTRMLTYEPEISPATRAYCDAVRAFALVDAWYEAAVAEPQAWLLQKYENPS